MANNQNDRDSNQQNQGSNNKGNFKNDPERAAREGQKGGQASRRS
jgi:general stress protein YciG